jgi:peptidoglycan-N-acetylglucosamine deacetylase
LSIPRIVTTSWDDGDPQDLRIAEMLRARGLRGSFYIPIIGYDGRPTLDSKGLRTLAAQGFEIGAHGVSHHTLPKFRAKELRREIRICKERLEDILGDEVRMFCYPKGRYSARVIREVTKAGYRGGRTTEMLGHNLDFDPYRMSTTLQVYPHTKTQYLKNMARSLHFARALDWAAHFWRAGTWVELAKRTFDRVLVEGGIWHIYGHSWEIEESNLWTGLADVLDYVSRQQGVLYVSNVEALKFLPAKRKAELNPPAYCENESRSRP